MSYRVDKKSTHSHFGGEGVFAPRPYPPKKHVNQRILYLATTINFWRKKSFRVTTYTFLSTNKKSTLNFLYCLIHDDVWILPKMLFELMDFVCIWCVLECSNTFLKTIRQTDKVIFLDQTKPKLAQPQTRIEYLLTKLFSELESPDKRSGSWWWGGVCLSNLSPSSY